MFVNRKMHQKPGGGASLCSADTHSRTSWTQALRRLPFCTVENVFIKALAPEQKQKNSCKTAEHNLYHIIEKETTAHATVRFKVTFAKCSL